MKNAFITFAVLMSIIFLPLNVMAEGADSIVGMLAVTTDEAGAITGATLSAETYDESDNVNTVTYKVVMDETGKAMAEAMGGSEVKVSGTISASEDEQTITVSSYESAQTEEAPPETGSEEPVMDDPDGSSEMSSDDSSDEPMDD
jgi:hypothetical protein